MVKNSRFTVAVHVLTLLASRSDERLTSGLVAQSVNTNPVVVRRLLSELKAAGWVETRAGGGGGCRLACAPELICLSDVYAVVEPGALFGARAAAPDSACPVGSIICGALAQVFADAERGLREALSAYTVADILAQTMCPKK